MWLPLQLVLEFLGRSRAWLAVMAALGAAAALIVAAAARRPGGRRGPDWSSPDWWGRSGRLGGRPLRSARGPRLPVWRRAVPLAWSAGGALLGAAAVAWAVARRRGSPCRSTATAPASPRGSRGARPGLNRGAGGPVDDFAALLTDPATTIAVVGATDDPAKFGGRIYRDLKGKGFRVLAVNPRRDDGGRRPLLPLARRPARGPDHRGPGGPAPGRPRGAAAVPRPGPEARVAAARGGGCRRCSTSPRRTASMFRADDCIMVRARPRCPVPVG